MTIIEVVKTSITATNSLSPDYTYTNLDDQLQQTFSDTIDTEDDHH